MGTLRKPSLATAGGTRFCRIFACDSIATELLQGCPVVTAEGRRIGTVEALLIDRKTRQLRYVMLEQDDSTERGTERGTERDEERGGDAGGAGGDTAPAGGRRADATAEERDVRSATIAIPWQALYFDSATARLVFYTYS